MTVNYVPVCDIIDITIIANRQMISVSIGGGGGGGGGGAGGRGGGTS